MGKLLSIGWFGAVLLLALCGAVSGARASTIVTAVWTGTVRGGFDGGGYFGV